MEPINSYQNFIERLKCKYGDEEDRIICLLFSDPFNDDAVSAYIDRRYDYLNERSGKYIDFFCPGYYYYRNNRRFCAENYARFIKNIEKISRWQYNGGTNLLLIRYRNGKLYFDEAYDINLTRMLIDGLIDDYRCFFEMLIREFENIEEYLERQAAMKHIENIWDNLSDLLPQAFRKILNTANGARKIRKFFLPHDFSL